MLEDESRLFEAFRSLTDSYRRTVDLYEENKELLREKAAILEKELLQRDSPDVVLELRNQMHYYRRECEDVLKPKLKEAEAVIENYISAAAEKDERIADLVLECQQYQKKLAKREAKKKEQELSQ
jgi:hypothetical protein